MNYNELRTAMSNYNKKEKRFKIDGDTLYIGDYYPVKFNESNYLEALKIVNDYGMLKDNSECLGYELFYKGLNWNNLSKKQKDSIIDNATQYANTQLNVSVIPSSMYEQSFHDNKSFLIYTV